MKLSIVAFRGDAPCPRSGSPAKGDWVPCFRASSGFDIVKEGDTVLITHKESGRTWAYPFSSVAGAEVAKDEPQTGKMTAPALAASAEKRGKR